MVRIRLLGPPAIERGDGVAAPPPRGRKAWALLAYLLLAERPPGRGPAGALRWTLAESLELVRAERWLAFLPWPEALNAELDLRAGRVDAAADQLEHAWALARHLDDPCWEGMAARGLGLLGAARASCTRTTDRYQWVSAHVLDAVVGAAIDHQDEAEAARLADALASLAARGDMRELVVRAHLHRARLGDPTALATARPLAAGVDNPTLEPLLDGEGATAGRRAG